MLLPDLEQTSTLSSSVENNHIPARADSVVQENIQSAPNARLRVFVGNHTTCVKARVWRCTQETRLQEAEMEVSDKRSVAHAELGE
jgi:hypothetical protein